MAKRKFQLSEPQCNRLLTAYLECDDGDTRSRFQAVRLYGMNYTVQAIQEITACRPRTLLEWVRAYQQAGLDGLRDHRVGGNSAKLTPAQRAEVERYLQQFTPKQILHQPYTQDGQFWTIEDLRDALAHWFGVQYNSHTSYYNLLRACGFSYQRTEKAFKSQRPMQIAEFQETVEKNSWTSPKTHRRR
jgi:transposase